MIGATILINQIMSISDHLSKKFFKALENGNLEECKSVYQMSVDMRKPFDLHQDDEYFFRLACYHDKLNVAQWLYEQCTDEGSTINIYAQNNYAFHTAYESKYDELYRWLYALYEEHSR